MIDLGPLVAGFGTALPPYHLALMAGGELPGILVGVLPGPGAPNGVGLSLQQTFGMAPIARIVPLPSLYWGALSAGASSATRSVLPRRAWSVATTYGAYPPAATGRAAAALASASRSAAFAALAGVLVVTLLATSMPG